MTAQETIPWPRAEAMPRHQQLIITIFGLYARQEGAAIAVADVIRLVGELGVEPSAVRSSISRLKKRGVLISTRTGGAAAYAVSPEFRHVFTEGDQRIFQGSRAGVNDPWLLAAFSIPEAKRHLRHQLRALLTRRGFGAVTPGLWIAPGKVEVSISLELERADLLRYVDLFTGHYRTSDADMRTKVAQWWDLEGIASLYREFMDETEEMWSGAAASNPRAAFCSYVPLLTKWRRLPYRDPGLPLGFLPADWPGEIAEERFAILHVKLAPLAREHAMAIVGM